MIRIFIFSLFLGLSACSDGDDEPTASNNAVTDDVQVQFLADNAAREGVTVTESGLQYEVLRASDGAMPSAESTITVDYLGELVDGTEFDSSYRRGEPNTFGLAGTIPGWVEGVQLMNVGSQFRFVMPSDLAYGESGAGSLIGPNAVLVFEIDLLEINSN